MNNASKAAPFRAELGPELLSENRGRVQPGVAVRVVRSREEVEEIRGIWSAWPSHRDSDIDFCVELIWTREEVIRPHAIVVYRDGLPDAMLVGRLERTRMTSKIGYLRLPGISARSLAFSYGGFLGNTSPENCSEIIASIMTTLREGEADMAVLDHLAVGSTLYEKALSVAGFATRDHAIKPGAHKVMVLPPDVEALYRGFSQGLRAEVRRKKKKLLADFGEGIEVRPYHGLDDVDAVIPILEEVAKKTYQRGLGVGFADTPEMRARLRFCAQKGWLRIFVLSIKGTPRAFWIGTLSNQVFVSDYNGYDPGFRDYSIGTFLLADVVEGFCKQGVKAVDFGFGEAEYKDRFANLTHTEASVCIFSPQAKGVLMNAMRTSTAVVDGLARKALDRTKLLPRMKKLWRLRLAKRPH